MARLDKWQTNLTELIERKRDEPFKLGTFDCSLWAMFAIHAVNGLELYTNYVGKYVSQKGALKKLAEVDGVGYPLELFEKHLGERKPIVFARKGDIVFTANPNLDIELPSDFDVFGAVPGVCYGSQSIFVGEHGLIFTETLTLDFCLWVS